MAQKPRDQWSDAYRKRIERAEARGLSRQAARGHKSQEHVTRRLRKEGKLPAYQPPRKTASSPQKYERDRIARFLRHAEKQGRNVDRDEFKEWAAETGRAMELIDLVQSMEAQYKLEVKQKRYIRRDIGFLNTLAEQFGVPVEWLFYK